MDVVRRLRRTPQSQLVIGIEMRDRRVLLQREMRVAFIKENVFAHEVCLCKAFVKIAEFEIDFFVYVAAIAVFMYARLVNPHGLFDARDGLKRLVLDLYQIHSVERCVFVNGSDGCDRIAYEAHFVYREGMLVLTDGKDTVRNR